VAPPAGAILLGAQFLELRRESAPALVELQQPVDRCRGLRATPRECGADGVRLSADQSQIENARLSRFRVLLLVLVAAVVVLGGG
jgi:hypothetical protein